MTGEIASLHMELVYPSLECVPVDAKRFSRLRDIPFCLTISKLHNLPFEHLESILSRFDGCEE